MAAPQDLNAFAAYVCPVCKGPLDSEPGALCCPACSKTYPVEGTIVNFLAPLIGQVDQPLVQQVNRMEKTLKTAARLYEGRFWYPLVTAIYLGSGATSIKDLTRRIAAALNVEQGNILDAACGTATYGRRFATPARAVYGIDLSMAMLQQGEAFVREEVIQNVRLSRTRVETLPFHDQFFDFAICSGALHLFPDPALALSEICRTLKPGARLVGMTFWPGDGGLVKYQWFRDMVKRRGTVRLFELAELTRILRQAGFGQSELQTFGSGVFFTARKCTPRQEPQDDIIPLAPSVECEDA